MLIVRFLRLQHLAFYAALCLGSAVVAWGGCNRPRPRPTIRQVAAAQRKPASADESAACFRLVRDAELSRQQEALTSLIGEVDTDETVRAEAEKELWRLTRVQAAEHEAEALLAVEGWREAVVTVVGDEATVVLRGSNLTVAEAASIGRLVAKATGLSETAVRILERP